MRWEVGPSAATRRNLSLQHRNILSPGQGCCCSPPAGAGPERVAGSFEISLCTYLLSSCQLWSTSSACSICTGSSCLCLSHTVGWTWEERRNKTWSHQPGICTPLTLSSPNCSPRPCWATHCLNPEKSKKVCRKWIEWVLAWPGSSSSPPPFPPAGSTAISDHPPCEDCDGFGCESVTVTQVVLVQELHLPLPDCYWVFSIGVHLIPPVNTVWPHVP